MKKTRYVRLFTTMAMLGVLFANLGILDNRMVISQEKPKPEIFDVRKDFGGVSDGKTINTSAINEAIKIASVDGVRDDVTNTVLLSGDGDYLSFSIQMRSNVKLQVAEGAQLIAADPRDGKGKYDSPEINPYDQYQDFGHSHWHNSLIWAENCENISIVGPGLIWGKGLVSSGGQSRTKEQNEILRKMALPATTTPFGYPNPRDAVESGWANKTIAIKNCRNVVIGEGLTIKHGGHFAILLTGVDGFLIDQTIIDTNRDGIDIDVSKNGILSNNKVNAPFDDAIVVKSSYALGVVRVSENITITKNEVSGFDEGTLLDGTFKREYTGYPDKSPNGRIKIGTESTGGFKNINITHNKFIYSRGLAITVVDGGVGDGIIADNNTMRDVTNSPFFVRCGNRARGPKETTGVGQLRNIQINNLIATNVDSRYASTISGIPNCIIEDLTLKNINIQYKGGGTKEQAFLEPPEKESDYPEPSMFGTTPASGLYARHVKGLTIENMILSFLTEDQRPAFSLNNTEDFSLKNSPPFADLTLSQRIKLKSF